MFYRNISAYILIWTFFISSCNQKTKQACKDYTLQDYVIDIKFSSFWDCGVFKRIILNNKGYGFSPDYTFCKQNTLYTINTKGRCEKIESSDTLGIPLTMIKSDSIFDMANKFIKGYTLENHISICDSNLKIPYVTDGASISVTLCLENKCLQASYYHYGHLEDISADLNTLLGYINSLNNKK